MQNKKTSFIEALSNIVIGYTINFIMNMIVLPFFVDGFTVSDNLIIGLIYTFISLARAYIIRRWFNKKEVGCE